MTEVCSVLCILIPYCPPELPSIVLLSWPILSSSHCVCVKKLVPPAGPRCRGARLKGPRRDSFWTPVVPVVWCSASLCCLVSLSGTPGGLLLQTSPTTIFVPHEMGPHPSSNLPHPLLRSAALLPRSWVGERVQSKTVHGGKSSACDQTQLAHILSRDQETSKYVGMLD